MKNVLLALLLFVPTCLLAHSDSEEKGRKLTLTFWKYAREQNYKKLDASLSDTFRSLSSHGPGNKKQSLQFLMNPKIVDTVIHDLVVIPKLSTGDKLNASFNMERSQVENELRRVADFAFMARNQYEAIERIKNICSFFDLNLFEISENMK